MPCPSCEESSHHVGNQNLFVKVGMNAVFVSLVEAEIQYFIFFSQICCQPPKFLMEEGIVIEGMRVWFSCFDFSSAKASR